MKKTNNPLEPSRLSGRGTTDSGTVQAILDEGLVVHVSFSYNGEVRTLPVGYACENNSLYIHGSSQSRFFHEVTNADGMCCLSVALMDGMVLAKSAFHHSFNYRSVVAFAKAERVTEPEEKMNALRVFTEKYIPGRWEDCRQPNEGEMKATMVVRFSLDKASAKQRGGGPSDAKQDMSLPYWSGVIPLNQSYAMPLPAEESMDKQLPEYLHKLTQKS